MSDKVPAAPNTLLPTLQVVSEGGLRRCDTGPNGFAAAPSFGRVQQCMARGWVREVGEVFCLTEMGRVAMELAELGLRGMTMVHATLLLLVAAGDVVQVGPDTKVAYNDRGRQAYRRVPAVPVYLGRQYELVELPPGAHVWRLTKRGEQALNLLVAVAGEPS